MRVKKLFELTNHLGNVLVTITDRKLGVSANGSAVDYYNADVASAVDYYPGGMTMPGRTFTASNSSYRYGFNGKEKDNEVKGEGNQYDYGLRIYDPRTVRFYSVDPLTKQYPQLTPYQFASNSPIANIDLDGGEAKYYNVYSTSISFYGKETKLKNSTHENIQRNAGWHWNGVLPSYTKEGYLGSGTLYTIYHRQVDVHWDDKQGKTVQTESMVQVGSIYVPPPPKPTPERPISSFSIGIHIFGSGFDPSDNTGDRPNPDAKIITFNLKEFQEIMEPVLLGLDVKHPADLEVPTLDEIIEHAGEYELDKKIDAMNKKWEDYPKNAPTYCRTCRETFIKKDGAVTYDTTNAPAEDTIDYH